MITQINIKGYKSIKEQKIPLAPINIFIGANGVGKSNFISAFSFIRAIYEQNLSGHVIKKGGADSLLYFGKKNTDEILFDIYFDKINRFIVNLGVNQNTLYIKSTRTAFKPQPTWQWRFKNYEQNVSESSFKYIHTNQAYWVNDRLKEFAVFHFHDTGDNSPIKGLSNISDNRTLKKDGSNIAAFLYFLKKRHPKHFTRIEKTIKSIAPFFEKFKLAPSNINPSLIELEWQEKGNPESYFNAYSLSDGTLRFICLATLLLQPFPPESIIIDEPELGLHPVAINKLSSIIRKISVKTQLIISTQSINLIDNFEPKDIVVSDRIDNQTVFKRLNNEEFNGWLENYSLGDIWGKNIFGGQPFDL